MKTALITGGGSGIGQALARALAERGLRVIVAGRTADTLAQTQQRYPEQIHTVVADVGTAAGRDILVKAVKAHGDLQYIVHNAALVKPLKPLQTLDLEQWRQAQAVNVEAPLFLTQQLVPLMTRGRVLHISSGLAHRALSGMAAYCISKAALHMAYLVCQADYADSAVLFGSVRPGTVDTPMQNKLRAADAEDLPVSGFFQDLKANDQLLSPAEVATGLRWLLLDSSDGYFTQQDWLIADILPYAHHPD